jgi:hypothetical protein
VYDDPTLPPHNSSPRFGPPSWPPQPAPAQPPDRLYRVARRSLWPLVAGGPLLLGALLGWGASAELPNAPDLAGRRAVAEFQLVRETRMTLGTRLGDLVTAQALDDATQTQRAGELVVQPIARLFAQFPPQILMEVVAAYAAVASVGSETGAAALIALRDALGQLSDAAQDTQLHLNEFRVPIAAQRDKRDGLDALLQIARLVSALEAGVMPT